MDITEFIAARLAEDEASEHALIEGNWTGDWQVDRYGAVRDQGFEERSMNGVIHDRGTWRTVDNERANRARAEAEHIARHDPARALREVAAKRLIVELHDRVHDCPVIVPTGNPGAFPGTLGYVSTEHVDKDSVLSLCTTLREIAAVYSDHPDYRAEWKP